jgi:hypothetical protein
MTLRLMSLGDGAQTHQHLVRQYGVLADHPQRQARLAPEWCCHFKSAHLHRHVLSQIYIR